MKRVRSAIIRTFFLGLMSFGLTLHAEANLGKQFTGDNQTDLKHASDTLTDPVYQDKKKANKGEKKKAEAAKEDSSVLDTLKEMFNNAFDYFYSTEEIKEEKAEPKKR